MKTKLTQEEKRIKIAEACGYKHYGCTGCAHSPCVCREHLTPGDDPVLVYEVPKYFECLNACHEVKKTLTKEQCRGFQQHLQDAEKASLLACIEGRRSWSERWTWGQPPEVEADCLGLTLNLWEAGE